MDNTLDTPPGTAEPGRDDAGSVAVPADVSSSYPGGKSGAGIYQRLINLIPRHRVLISAFAGKCGVTRKIKPAEHTIVIDADERVCEWWDNWRRSKDGRGLEIHHCDSIEWLRYRFGVTEYSDAGSDGFGSRDTDRLVMGVAGKHVAAGTGNKAATAVAKSVTRETLKDAAEAFIFCDPPYVLSQRSHGKQYACELTDVDHIRLLRILTQIPATQARIMLCGYACPLYASLDPWRSIDHRVPTRGGLQDERIWLNYEDPDCLQDYRFIGDDRRERERIRRRQKSWSSQLSAMSDRERQAMMRTLGI